MNEVENYNSNNVIVKGRMSASLTTLADVGGCNILLNQGGLLDTPSTIDLSSSSALDTALGTGARTVTIYGLGENKKYNTETISLAGTTVVTSAKKWYRVFIIKVTTFGNTGANQGDLYAVKTGTGGTYSTPGVPGTFTIASAIFKSLASTNQGTTCFYTTPNIDNGLWIVDRIDLSTRTQPGTMVVLIQDYANGSPATREAYVEFPAGAALQLDMRPYNIKVNKLTDIRVLALGATAGGIVHAAMTIKQLNAGCVF